MLRCHTVVAGLVIASFVALQATMFLHLYAPGGRIQTEAEAISLARAACPDVKQFPVSQWHAVLRDGVWTAHAESFAGFFRNRFEGDVKAEIDARTGKVIGCGGRAI
jgi:hypothetical protein